MDAAIIWGSAEISTEHLTGEPDILDRGLGYIALAGSKVHGGPLVLRVIRKSSESMLARLEKLTMEARVCTVSLSLRVQ